MPGVTIPETLPATGSDVAVSITRSVTHQRIGVRLVFRGRLDESTLARAVRLTLDAEPVLGCSFVIERKAFWRRISDLDGASAFTMTETDDPERMLIRFQADGVADAGPQAAVLLLRTPDHDELGIKLSHVPVDGQGAKHYAYLLAGTYTALLADPSFVPVPNVSPRPTAADVWANLSPDQRTAAKKAKSWAVPNWPAPLGGAAGTGITYRALDVPPERFRALKEYGKRLGATVNETFLALYFRALVRALDPPDKTRLSLMSTADHRRYLPDPDAHPIGMLSISGPLGIERVHGEPLEGTIGRVREAMAAWERQCYGAGPAFNAGKLGRFSYKTVKRILTMSFGMSPKGMTYPYFTNIGVLDDTRLGFGTLTPVDGSMCGPASLGASPIATVSTYADALTVSMGCSEDRAATDITDEILGLLDDEIEQCLAAT